METGRQKLKDEKNFYDSLDEKNSHSSCSCQSLILLFFLLFILSTLSSYYLIKKIKRSSVNYPSFSLNKKANSGQVRTLTIYQSDLQSQMTGDLGGLIPLANKKVFIRREGVVLEGTLTPYSKDKIIFIAEPRVKNQKIALENVRLTSQSSKTNIPPFIEKAVAKSISSAINSRIKLKISDIQLKKEQMDLTVY